MSGGITRTARRPEGWKPPGPTPPGARGDRHLEPGPGEDLCFLTGEWRIFQRLRGQRWSLDDLVTAATAADALPSPRRILDLGTGIGSVLLMVAWRHLEASMVGIEAQEVSVGLARRSIAYNGVEGRCRVVHGDIRDPACLPTEARFQLITGTPPYFPPGTAATPEDAQCHQCRTEERGGVEAYLAAAARWLDEGGIFVMCAGHGQAERVARAAADTCMSPRSRLVVVPKERKAPLLDVHTFSRGGTASSSVVPSTLVVRGADGQWTKAYRSLRAAMGLPPRPPARKGTKC